VLSEDTKRIHREKGCWAATGQKPIGMVLSDGLYCVPRGALYLIGFLCYLPFEGFLPEDRRHIFVREVLLLIPVLSVMVGIVVVEHKLSKRSGFICRSCGGRMGQEVEAAGCCGHCGVRAFESWFGFL
jgi:hypothetical protein